MENNRRALAMLLPPSRVQTRFRMHPANSPNNSHADKTKSRKVVYQAQT